ncbi:hypothetical protein LVD15_01960 [Fulvivirga maritima]|uniref:hypothetical protein n=1 Tax=Fulvivirga maritima TaxID=2904247 RepID=UPI001F36EDCE|nr:hypothetical protein [Fulvivirga maritima]UII27215.1 hypothetical protein LVD15_01960 [Fulvivirga maritima]
MKYNGTALRKNNAQIGLTKKEEKGRLYKFIGAFVVLLALLIVTVLALMLKLSSDNTNSEVYKLSHMEIPSEDSILQLEEQWYAQEAPDTIFIEEASNNDELRSEMQKLKLPYVLF